MRIDKYLWAIRVFKTRSLASTACRNGKVTLDDDAVKPSREVQPEQVVKVRKGAVWFTYRVKALPKNRVGAKLVEDYREDLTPASEVEKLTFIKIGSRYERPGEGRPTKRDRRAIDKFRQGG